MNNDVNERMPSLQVVGTADLQVVGTVFIHHYQIINMVMVSECSARDHDNIYLFQRDNRVPGNPLVIQRVLGPSHRAVRITWIGTLSALKVNIFSKIGAN